MEYDSSRHQVFTFAADASCEGLGNSIDSRPSEIILTISSDDKITVGSAEEIGDVKRGKDLNLERNWVCRICLSNSESVSSTSRSLSTKGDLIQLGCKCKGEIGLIHVHCAQDWFTTKGNRCCEICGDTAKNIVQHLLYDTNAENTTSNSGANDTTAVHNIATSTFSKCSLCICLIVILIWMSFFGYFLFFF